MLANDFRRIALAQGLLPAEAPRRPAGTPPPAPPDTPASSAPEPCEKRGDVA